MENRMFFFGGKFSIRNRLALLTVSLSCWFLLSRQREVDTTGLYAGTTVKGEFFTQISNKEIDGDPNLFSMAVTESGKLFSIPMDIEKISPYTFSFTEESGLSQALKVKNACYMTKKQILAILTYGGDSTIKYQLFSPKEENPLELAPTTTPGGLNFGSLDLMAGGTQNLLTTSIDEEEEEENQDQLIAVISNGVQFLEYNWAQESIQLLNQALQGEPVIRPDSGTQILNGLIRKEGERFYLYLIKRKLGYEYPVSYSIQITHQEENITPTIKIEKITEDEKHKNHDSFLLEKTGITPKTIMRGR